MRKVVLSISYCFSKYLDLYNGFSSFMSQVKLYLFYLIFGFCFIRKWLLLTYWHNFISYKYKDFKKIKIVLNKELSWIWYKARSVSINRYIYIYISIEFYEYNSSHVNVAPSSKLYTYNSSYMHITWLYVYNSNLC